MQESKTKNAVLQSKNSKESLPDSDHDPDVDSDSERNQFGSRSRARETGD
jgi:hypothetical protein